MRVDPTPCVTCKWHRDESYESDRDGNIVYQCEHCALMQERNVVVTQNGVCQDYEKLSPDELRFALCGVAYDLWQLYVDSNDLIDRDQLRRETKIRERLRDLGVGV